MIRIDKGKKAMDTIIFDMDGTLIDTEGYYNRCWVRAIREAGYEITPNEALDFRSLGRPFAIDCFKERFGPEVDYHGIRARRKELMKEMVEKERLRLKPGVHELLEVLRERKIRPMIATATDLERTSEYLRKLDIYDEFDKIISAVMVRQGKPAPDIYLYACEQAGRSPGECIAVEDSPNGVRSAAAAGCRVIMVPDLSQPDEKLEKLIEKKAVSLLEIRDWVKENRL